MIAINNAALNSNTAGIGIPPVNLTLFVPGVTWAYSGTNITVTDAATITSPDTFAKANITITDNQGVSVYGVITTATGNSGAISVAGINYSGPLTIQVTESSTLGVQCSGQSSCVTTATATGTIGYWEVTASTNHA